MKRICIPAACGILMLITLNASAQLTPDSVMKQYNNTAPQEKLYVHFDNNVYVPGQTVWYKIYLQSTKTATDISRNVYIDWYDEQGKIIAKHVSPVNRSASWGSFEIPAAYTGNRLHAVAYTQWMLNFDSSLLYRKELAVVNGKNAAKINRAAPAEPVLRFFAEGGDLVEGLSSVLAFKALNTDAQPPAASGNILNKEGKSVAAFTTMHDGMGKLFFTPLPGEIYTVEWTDALGKTHKASLPAVKKSGIVLTVKEGTLDRFFNLAWTPDIAEKTKRFQVVAHSNQKLLFKAVAEIKDKKTVTGTLPLSRFPSGVITLTILNETGQPLAERILFVNNEEYKLDVSIGFDTVGLQKRNRNVYEINIPDSVPANLSLAITAGELPSDSSENIITSLLLSSEIKGHITNPAYYFSSDEDSVKQQLDLVMLTNGWRRFNWEDAVKLKKPLSRYQKEDQFLSLTGTIKNYGSKAAMKKAKTINLIFQSKDSSRSFALLPVNDESWFEYQNMLLFDTVQVFYQLNNTDLKGNTAVTATTSTRPFNPRDSLNVWQPGLWEPLAQATIPPEYQGALGTTLAEVIVRGKTKSQAKRKIDEMNDTYTTGMFKQGDAYQFDMTDNETIKSSTSIITYLQGKVAGLRTESYGGNLIIRWRGNNSFGGATQGDPVAVLVNEMMTSANELLNINPRDIAYIKVFRPPFLGVPLGNGGSGAIAVYTRNGADGGFETGVDKFSIAGYTPIKDFYSPDYAEQNQSYTQADIRRTLYWNPNILTDGYNNKQKIIFYNNDISHSMQVVLQGITEDGKLVYVSRLVK